MDPKRINLLVPINETRTFLDDIADMQKAGTFTDITHESAKRYIGDPKRRNRLVYSLLSQNFSLKNLNVNVAKFISNCLLEIALDMDEESQWYSLEDQKYLHLHEISYYFDTAIFQLNILEGNTRMIAHFGQHAITQAFGMREIYSKSGNLEEFEAWSKKGEETAKLVLDLSLERVDYKDTFYLFKNLMSHYYVKAHHYLSLNNYLELAKTYNAYSEIAARALVFILNRKNKDNLRRDLASYSQERFDRELGEFMNLSSFSSHEAFELSTITTASINMIHIYANKNDGILNVELSMSLIVILLASLRFAMIIETLFTISLEELIEMADRGEPVVIRNNFKELEGVIKMIGDYVESMFRSNPYRLKLNLNNWRFALKQSGAYLKKTSEIEDQINGVMNESPEDNPFKLSRSIRLLESIKNPKKRI